MCSCPPLQEGFPIIFNPPFPLDMAESFPAATPSRLDLTSGGHQKPLLVSTAECLGCSQHWCKVSSQTSFRWGQNRHWKGEIKLISGTSDPVLS